MTYELSNMTWIEAEENFSRSRVVIIPTGSVEQHGLHIGVGADWIQAWEIAKRVGERTGRIVLPVLPYGISGHHDDFPGVITLTPDTYRMVIFEILQNINRNGVDHVVFMNGHGGNLGGIVEACKKAREDFGMMCAICQWWDILQEPVLGHPSEEHAGYAETALSLASRPEAVKIEKAVLSATKQHDKNIELIRAGKARFKDGIVTIPLKTADVTDTGSMTEAHPEEIQGTRDYSEVTPEFAEALLNKVVNWMSAFVKDFEDFTVPTRSVSKDIALKELEEP